jgi:hypothetical protein
MRTGSGNGNENGIVERFLEVFESLDSLQKTYLEALYMFFVTSLCVGATAAVLRTLHYYDLYPFNKI